MTAVVLMGSQQYAICANTNTSIRVSVDSRVKRFFASVVTANRQSVAIDDGQRVFVVLYNYYNDSAVIVEVSRTIAKTLMVSLHRQLAAVRECL